jgi:hypothetical protein
LSVGAFSVRHVTSPDVEALRRYAFDHHGGVTGSAIAALGVRPTDLHDLLGAGELVLVAGDVYRMQDVVTPLTEYAEAVALAGPGAVLADDTVLALHDLAQIDPGRIRVAVPRRLADDAQLPPAVEVVVRELAPADVTEVECIPSMTVAAALRVCRSRMMTGRLLLAVDRAWEEGLLDQVTALALRAEFAPPTPSLEELMDELEQSRDPWEVLRSAGWLSLTELAARRGEPDVGAIGAWAYARRREGALIVLEAPDREALVVPAFQLTATGDPRPELQPLLQVLFDAPGVDGWTMWAWLTSPSSHLGGGSPEQLAVTDPGRALAAAVRFAEADEESIP